MNHDKKKLKKKLKEEADLIAGTAIGGLIAKGLSSLFDDDDDAESEVTDIDVDIHFDGGGDDSSDDDDFGGGDFGGGGASSDW